MSKTRKAPGGPGTPPIWTESAKNGVVKGTSRVWFTLSQGILTEVYFPRVDRPCTKDCQFIVTNGRDFSSSEEKDTESETSLLARGVPAYKVINRCKSGRYQIEKEIIADPERNTIIQRVRFQPLQGHPGHYRLYLLLAPHLAGEGTGNTGWTASYKGNEMLFAQRDGVVLALACSIGWRKRSVGYMGSSDAWHDLMQHKKMEWTYDRAEDGNIVLAGEIGPPEEASFLLALGFGTEADEAALSARASLLASFDTLMESYRSEWEGWQNTLCKDSASDHRDQNLLSACLIRTHEAKACLGGIIASLSTPWGSIRHARQEVGGYHLVWPRDLVEAAGGLMAVNAHDVAKRVIHYLQAVQEEDGKWSQNMWVTGQAYRSGIQLDETSLPILLINLARRVDGLEDELAYYWEMVRRAACYILRHGPVTSQDRWETDPGYSTFTLAAEISALLAAAEIAALTGHHPAARYLQETADQWNANIEKWVYATGTRWDRQAGVEGHYVRIGNPGDQRLSSSLEEQHAVAAGALALVRFGLRSPDDPRIVNTAKVIDMALKKETPYGPAWRRYPGDDYGEHADGSPFDGSGIGSCLAPASRRARSL